MTKEPPDYEPLPRPRPGRSPSTLEQAYNYGQLLGRAGVGFADYAVVTALTSHKQSWWNAHGTGWRQGRKAAGHPKLRQSEMDIEVEIARNAP
jgi:hypothetical protein